jgi:hypothetical protein
LKGIYKCIPLSSSNNEVDKYGYKKSPMVKRMERPITASGKKIKNKYSPPNDRHTLSFFEGFLDDTRFPILDGDYYAWLGAAGYYDNSRFPIDGPLTHDTNTTTALHYYDISKKKTPVDKRTDTINPNLSQVALDYSNAELYDVQDFATQAEKRIKEKTHRILNDPIRKIQSQALIDIQKVKGDIIKNKTTIAPLQQVILYNQMLLTVNTLLLERITDIVDLQEKLYMFNKYETKPLANNFYAEMTLVAGNDATKLDFTDSTNNKNIPATAKLYDFPKHNLLSLQVIFDSGTDLYFATNKPANSLETTVKLTSPPQQYTLTPGQFSIKSVNLRASGTDGTVRLIGLY